MLQEKNIFADVIKLKILRLSDCPGLSKWALNSIKEVLQSQKVILHRYTEKKSIWNWSRERCEDDGLEDWNDVTIIQGKPVVNRNQKKPRNGFSPKASGRMALLIFWF